MSASSWPSAQRNNIEVSVPGSSHGEFKGAQNQSMMPYKNEQPVVEAPQGVSAREETAITWDTGLTSRRTSETTADFEWEIYGHYTCQAAFQSEGVNLSDFDYFVYHN